MRIGRLFLVLCFIPLVTSCTLTETFLAAPLSQEEERFIGTWTHVHGIGNVWNKSFSEDRTLHSFSENLIWGSGEGFYLWEADGKTLMTYEQNKVILTAADTWDYTFIDASTLVIDGNEYTRQ
jgi:hypothetical protein